MYVNRKIVFCGTSIYTVHLVILVEGARTLPRMCLWSRARCPRGVCFATYSFLLLSTLHTPLARSSHRSLLPPARCSSRSSRIPPAHGALAFEKPIPLALATSHSPAPTVRPYREGATSSCALPRLRPTTPRSLRRGDCPTRRRRRVRARGGRRRGRPGRAGPPAPSPRSRRRCPGGRRGGRRALRGGRRRHWCPGGPGASSCSTCSSSYSVRTHSV